MEQPYTPPETALLTCAICRKEVPFSAAVTPETEDYVVHFCGLDCYEQWKQANTTTHRQK